MGSKQVVIAILFCLQHCYAEDTLATLGCLVKAADASK